MIDVLISGINGRMGRAVYTAASSEKCIDVVCGVDKFTVGNFNCPVYADIKDVPEHVDVIIDFSSPQALGGLLKFAKENNAALVIATTGHSKKQLEEIEEAAKFIPVCVKANTSKGIGAVLKVLPQLKKLLPGFDVTITETHRKNKKDKPSGTALALAKSLYPNGDFKENGMEILSLRGGDVPGIHEINFLGDGEVISIKHTVFSREVFARGAIETCVKIHTLPPGLYDL